MWWLQWVTDTKRGGGYNDNHDSSHQQWGCPRWQAITVVGEEGTAKAKEEEVVVVEEEDDHHRWYDEEQEEEEEEDKEAKGGAKKL